MISSQTLWTYTGLHKHESDMPIEPILMERHLSESPDMMNGGASMITFSITDRGQSLKYCATAAKWHVGFYRQKGREGMNCGAWQSLWAIWTTEKKGRYEHESDIKKSRHASHGLSWAKHPSRPIYPWFTCTDNPSTRLLRNHSLVLNSSIGDHFMASKQDQVHALANFEGA